MQFFHPIDTINGEIDVYVVAFFVKNCNFVVLILSSLLERRVVGYSQKKKY